MIKSIFAFAILIAAASASAMSSTTESFLKEVGADPRSNEVRAVAEDTVTTQSGEVLTLDSLAAKRDETAVKSFLVTRDFLRAFKEDPNIEFPDDEFYNIAYLTVQERAYIARKLMEGLPTAASALTLETVNFLRQAGVDPESEEVAAVASEGPVATDYDGDPTEYSLNSLAAEKKKNGIVTFLGTRSFIRRLKKDYEGTSIPKTNYDPLFLTHEERALVGHKFAEQLFKKKG